MVNIKILTPDDGEKLAELYQQLCGVVTELDKMKGNIGWIAANKDYYLIGAINNHGRLLGSLMGIVCRDIVGSCRPFMVLENVIVALGYRGHGIGTQLLSRIESIARERNCFYVMFVSSCDRKAAHRFYEKSGYRLDAVQGFKKYLPDLNKNCDQEELKWD
jgi:GNAT superfamily N-acetyltransferase